MASTGVIDGTDFRLTVNGSNVGYSTSCSMSMSAELRETIHKDNPGTGWRTFTVGQKSATINVSAFYNEDSSTQSYGNDPDDIASLFTAGTSVNWAFRTGVTGDDKYTGSGYITEMSFTADAEENMTYDFTIEVDGEVTVGTIT